MATKRIYIYVSTKDKNELNKIRAKYHVSLSTLADTVANAYMFYQQIKDKMTKYIFENQPKTSIKPRNDVHKFNENQGIIYTNSLTIYVNKLDKEYLPENSYKAVREIINKHLQEKLDLFWQYNEQIRNQRRMLKENKEYFKKALETL